MKYLTILLLFITISVKGQLSPTITWNAEIVTVDGVSYSVVGNFIRNFPNSDVSFTLLRRCVLSDPLQGGCDIYYGLTSDGDYFHSVNGQQITESNKESLLYGGSPTMIIDLLELIPEPDNDYLIWREVSRYPIVSRTFSSLNMMWSESTGTYEVCGMVRGGTSVTEICEQVPSMVWVHSDANVISTYRISRAPWPLQDLFLATLIREDLNNPAINYIGRTEEEVHTSIRNDIQN